jgi:hypothetical protein
VVCDRKTHIGGGRATHRRRHHRWSGQRPSLYTMSTIFVFVQVSYDFEPPPRVQLLQMPPLPADAWPAMARRASRAPPPGCPVSCCLAARSPLPAARSPLPCSPQPAALQTHPAALHPPTLHPAALQPATSQPAAYCPARWPTLPRRGLLMPPPRLSGGLR